MLKDTLLGQATVYVETYSPELLYPVPRSLARDRSGIQSPLSFDGVDIWNAFEISWLNKKGKPEIAMAEFSFPCKSEYIVESKSFKLYLNSLNQTKFDSIETVKKTIEKDISEVVKSPIKCDLYHPCQLKEKTLKDFQGKCLDNLDIEVDTYTVDTKFLITSKERVDESLYSDLLKSNCLATGQPDWGSLYIRYIGNKIDHVGLLKYIISFRSHSGFAEHCVEHIFQDILLHCKPDSLTVYARYTRRGGLDINPFRSNFEKEFSNFRQMRQ